MLFTFAFVHYGALQAVSESLSRPALGFALIGFGGPSLVGKGWSLSVGLLSRIFLCFLSIIVFQVSKDLKDEEENQRTGDRVNPFRSQLSKGSITSCADVIFIISSPSVSHVVSVRRLRLCLSSMTTFANRFVYQIVESIAMTYFNLRLRPPSMLDNIMGMIGGM